MSSDSSIDLGNTITKSRQDSPCKRWVFTLNNYTEDEVKLLNEFLSSNSSYIMAEESGEEGTKHLQGFINFNKKVRFTFIKKEFPRIHLEKARKNNDTNIKYCMKETGKKYGDLVPESIHIYKPVKKLEFLYKLMEEYEFPIGDRIINVIVDSKGGLGKTEFIRYCYVNLKGTIMLTGKGADMKNGVVEYFKTNNRCPKYVLMDIPRSSLGYISYPGIEEIKNMLFYSGKYEGSMINGNKPFVCMFMNEMPQLEQMSLDRWRIWEVDNDKVLRVRRL